MFKSTRPDDLLVRRSSRPAQALGLDPALIDGRHHRLLVPRGGAGL